MSIMLYIALGTVHDASGKGRQILALMRCTFEIGEFNGHSLMRLSEWHWWNRVMEVE